MEKGNKVEEIFSTNIDQEPVDNGENQCDLSLPSPVVATDVPIVEKQSDENEIVMLSDDENIENGKLKT